MHSCKIDRFSGPHNIYVCVYIVFFFSNFLFILGRSLITLTLSSGYIYIYITVSFSCVFSSHFILNFGSTSSLQINSRQSIYSSTLRSLHEGLFNPQCRRDHIQRACLISYYQTRSHRVVSYACVQFQVS